MSFVLGPNQYGKAEVRVVAVDRSRPQHALVDLNVSSSLRGDFADSHTAGDNGHVLATDTQKNTVMAFARDGVGSPEEMLAELRRRLGNDEGSERREATEQLAQITRLRVEGLIR